MNLNNPKEYQVYIFSNRKPESIRVAKQLREKLLKSNFNIADRYSKDVDLIIVIGGDGTFLSAVQTLNMPTSPIIGINTGHLGFFQELLPNQLDDLIYHFSRGNYVIQSLPTAAIKITLNDGKSYFHRGVNEICVKGDNTRTVHLDISIDGSFIERFSGDGILIATSSGSTAYSYSLGGAIVDPRIDLLQLTPIAPMNTTAYRSFTSSILLPSDRIIGISPDFTNKSMETQVIYDGFSESYKNVANMEVYMDKAKINLMRFEGYDFWKKVKNKFL